MALNRAFILGNLGQDPELRYTQNGTAVCTLNVATSEVRLDRDGNRQENTEWHRIVVWNKQAENCAKYLAKGRSVFVEGRIQTRSWEDKQSGQKRFTTEIVAQNVQFVGGGSRGDQRSPGGHESNYSSGPASYDQGSDLGGPGTPNLDEIPFMRLNEYGM